jgi:hypothetical protein
VKRQRVLLAWANEFDSGSDDKGNGWVRIYVCDVVAPHSMDQLVTLSMS